MVADNNRSKDEYYGTPTQFAANPRVLKQNYFGKAGTITVGLARKNENPWLSLLGRAGTALGIYSAFNPFEGCSWSWAFASAKAGYKRLGEEYYDQGYPNRAYRIDWDSSNQSWNLCQSDWDAVMVPVRCAESDAWNGNWNIGNTGMLADYVGAKEQWRWLTQEDDQANVVLGGWGDMIAGGQWQIGNPGVRLHWERLAERMFH